MNQKDLLKHADFVHSLARTLVRDENSAADVEQRTWLTALENPPPSDSSLRSWFSRVARNFIISTHRSETRRRKHEKASAPSEIAMSPEEIAMRKEALRRMSEAVLGLEEPYLSSIILRFYEDLPAREVARRLGIPHETAKTRIQRGLKQLRAKLDDAYGGDRQMWCLALAPLAGLPLASTAAAAAVSASSTVAAGGTTSLAAKSASLLAGSLWLKVLVVAALFTGASVVLIHVFPDSPTVKKTPGTNVAAEEAVASAADGIDEHPGPQDHATGAIDREALKPSGICVSGRVTDSITGNPVQTFGVWVIGFEKESGWRTPVREIVRDADGRFSFALADAGKYSLWIKAASYIPDRRMIDIRAQSGPSDLNIALDPGRSISGRVLDDETGLPVEDAIVGPAARPMQTDLIGLNFLGYEDIIIHGRTDARGRFSIRGLDQNDWKFAAVHPNYAAGSFRARPGSGDEVEIRLKKGFRIFGRALDDHGKPAGGLLIRLYGEAIPVPRPVLTAPDGTFTTDPVLPGRVAVKAGDPPPDLECSLEFTEEHRVVEIVDRDVKVDFGPSRESVTWRGTLIGYEGNPEQRATVIVRPVTVSFRDADRFNLTRHVRCDDQGRFEVAKLELGRYRVQIDHSGMPPFEWGMVAFDTFGVVERDIDLSQNISITGSVVDGVTGEPLTGRKGHVRAWLAAGPRQNFFAELDENGRFEIKGAEPGIYSFQAWIGEINSDPLRAIRIEKSESPAHITIPVYPLGRLKLMVEGFDRKETESFSVSFAREETGHKFHRGTVQIKDDGTRERDYSLAAGRWTVSISFKDLGYVERGVEIHSGLDTSLTVRRDEISPYEGFITIEGVISRFGGSPLPGITMSFHAYSAPGLPEESKRITAATDETGRFHAEGFKPGRWGVEADLASGQRVFFPLLWIPADAISPLALNLEMPAGKVGGGLIDQLTGLPFGREHPGQWKVSLRDIRELSPVSSCSSEYREDRFLLEGLPEGEYQLFVESEGYEDHQSAAFSLFEGQHLYIGELGMEPCGLLDLEVVNPSFAPIERFRVTCEGFPRKPCRTIGARQRFDKLPVGPVIITVSARGYLEKSLQMNLEPARPCEIRIVLTPATPDS